jgi:hypothetical protein
MRIRIRDLEFFDPRFGMERFGSWINIPDPQHCLILNFPVSSRSPDIKWTGKVHHFIYTYCRESAVGATTSQCVSGELRVSGRLSLLHKQSHPPQVCRS